MRKFKIVVFDKGIYSVIEEYFLQSTIRISDLAKQVRFIFTTEGISASRSPFRALAYNQGGWLKSDEIVNNLPYNVTIIILVAESLIQTLGDSVELFNTLAGFVVRRKSQLKESEILKILKEIRDELDTEETLFQKVNAIVQLHPNIFGIGIDLNELIKHLFKKE